MVVSIRWKPVALGSVSDAATSGSSRMRFAGLGAVTSNTRPDLRSMMSVAAASGERVLNAGRMTLARRALTVAGRVGRLVESRVRGCLVRSVFGRGSGGHGRHVSVHGGAFKA